MLKSRYYVYPHDANCSFKHIAEYIYFQKRKISQDLCWKQNPGQMKNTGGKRKTKRITFKETALS